MVDESALQQLADAGSDELGRLLLRAVRSVNEQIIGRLVALGHPNVRGPHTAVFANLDTGGTRAVILAQRAGMTRQSMSNLIRELEAIGYVDVRPDPEDGRAALVQHGAAEAILRVSGRPTGGPAPGEPLRQRATRSRPSSG
jgi:MarR family protein